MSQSPTKKKSKGGGRSYLRDSRISIDGARHPDIPPRQSSRSPPFPPPPGHPSFSTSFAMSRNNAASLSFPSTSFATSRNNATSSALDFVHPTAFGTAAVRVSTSPGGTISLLSDDSPADASAVAEGSSGGGGRLVGLIPPMTRCTITPSGRE